MLPQPSTLVPRPHASLPGMALLGTGCQEEALPGGRSSFLGFNEIIYCLFALTKTANVTGEV